MTYAKRWLIAAAAAFAGALSPSAASAAEVLRFGPFHNSASFIGFDCGAFEIRIDSEGTDAFTVWLDDEGYVERVLYRARYPRDVLTNTVTGKSIVVRGNFQSRIERIEGTADYTKTVVGFRYMVNEPGEGATLRDVGRITYSDVENSMVLWEAGHHDLALESQLLPAFCEALE